MLPTFTDALLDRISTVLAGFPPERGGALLAAGGVTHYLTEDQAGTYTSASWDISPALTGEVQAAELAGYGRLSGTVHTHPEGAPDPSPQDMRATGRMLDENSHLDEMAICIVTRGRPRPSDLAIGPEHRMSVHLARRGPGGTTRIAQTDARIVLLSKDVKPLGLDPHNAKELSWAGRTYLALHVSGDNGNRTLLVPNDYPLAGPIVLDVPLDGHVRRAATAPWDAGAPSGPQLARLVDQHATRPAGFLGRTGPLVGQIGRRKVLIIGLGSVGTTVVNELVRTGVENLVLVDPDVVEGSNLARTTYEAYHVGIPKCDATAELISRINPAATMQTIQASISDLDDRLLGLCEEADLVVATTDDPDGQAVLSHYAYAAGTPLISAALYRQANAGEVVISVPEIDTPCWSCSIGGGGERPEKDYATGRLVGEIALGPPIHLVSLIAASIAIAVLSGPATPAGEPLGGLLAAGRTVGIIANKPNWEFFDELFQGLPGQWAPQSVWARVERHPDCPVCGSERIPPLRNFGGAVKSVIGRLRNEVEATSRRDAGIT